MNKWFQQFWTFLQESWVEVRHKVTWPSRNEVTGTTLVVVATTASFAVFLGIVDYAMIHVVRKFFALFA